MGDRISISFRNEKNTWLKESVTLFSHWGGQGFATKAKEYVRNLKKRNTNDRIVQPLDRLEPNTVMVDFIRHITKNMKRVESDLYLGKDEMDGDNSDNGHTTIDL